MFWICKNCIRPKYHEDTAGGTITYCEVCGKEATCQAYTDEEAKRKGPRLQEQDVITVGINHEEHF